MRNLKVKVKSAKGRSISSTRWLQRQLNDPFVKAAKLQGFRSRSAFKLIEIDNKFNLLKKGYNVLDLGCAPGGWCQVAAQKVGMKSPENLVQQISLPQLLHMTLGLAQQPDFQRISHLPFQRQLDTTHLERTLDLKHYVLF